MTTDIINRFYYGFIRNTDEWRKLCDYSYQSGLCETQDQFDAELIVLIRLAFQAGARWEMRESARLAPHIAKFLEMVVLLGPDPGASDWMDNLPSDDTSPYEPSITEFDLASAYPNDNEPREPRVPASVYPPESYGELRDDIPF